MNNLQKILIVDDDEDVLNIIETVLSNEGFQVVKARNKIEGFEKIKSEKPDLAILDVMMTTEYDGFELAAKIREDKELKNTPLLIQTSIFVIETTENDIIKMVHQYRKSMNDKELRVVLVRNIDTNSAGIDFIDNDGKTLWIDVNGFIKKPVIANTLLTEIERILS